jgi:tetratricopeptide (TPR) repeat protein
VAPQIRAIARARLALALLRQQKPRLALAEAERAVVDGRGTDSELRALSMVAVSQAAAGAAGDAAKTLSLIESRVKALPGDADERQLRWARGEVAFLQGDTATAAAELSAAAGMLPAQGPPLGPPSPHGDLWLAAAQALIKAGRDADAARLLERLQSGHERLFAMEAWARSFYLLGGIYERLGDTARAREQYTRFLDLWRDGDMERGWVEEARKKLAR